MTYDERYMGRAIELALSASLAGERPFGCVVADPYGEVIGHGAGSEWPDDVLRHSECVAIREACSRRGQLLHGCTLYSTHEPCVLCAGAICHSKLSRVVYGSRRSDLPELFRQRRIALEDILADTTNPPAVAAGVLGDECVCLFDAEVAVARRAA